MLQIDKTVATIIGGMKTLPKYEIVLPINASWTFEDIDNINAPTLVIQTNVKNKTNQKFFFLITNIHSSEQSTDKNARMPYKILIIQNYYKSL